MNYDQPYDGLNYDMKVVNEQLTLPFTDPTPPHKPAISLRRSVEEKLQEYENVQRMVKDEIEKRERNEKKEKEKNQKIESMTNGTNDFKEMFNRQTLLILVFVLAIVCVCQFVQQQNMHNSFERLILQMNNKNSG